MTYSQRLHQEREDAEAAAYTAKPRSMTFATLIYADPVSPRGTRHESISAPTVPAIIAEADRRSCRSLRINLEGGHVERYIRLGSDWTVLA